MKMQEHDATTASKDMGVPLDWMKLFRIMVPMALTFLMVSGSAPVITAGISWKFGAEGEKLHLASFLICFTTAISIYSPTFTARNIAIRTITGKRSMMRFAQFYALTGMVCSLLILLLALSASCGDFLFVRIQGNTIQQSNMVREGLLYFALLPMMVSFRGLAQGCHINNDQPWHVGLGTGLRLLAMVSLVLYFATKRPDMNGPVLGALTFLGGITIETVFVYVLLIGKKQWHVDPRDQPLAFGQFARYALPLMCAHVLQTCLQPMVILLINHASLPEESKSGFDLLRATLWVSLSMILALQAAMVAYATSRRNFKILLQFGLVLCAVISCCLAILAWTPLKAAVFGRLLRVDHPVILALLYASLPIALPLPFLALSSVVLAALHIRSGSTIWVTAGNLAGFLVLLGMKFSMNFESVNGVKLAILAFLVFHLTASLVQAAGLRKRGLDEALSSSNLSAVIKIESPV